MDRIVVYITSIIIKIFIALVVNLCKRGEAELHKFYDVCYKNLIMIRVIYDVFCNEQKKIIHIFNVKITPRH